MAINGLTFELRTVNSKDDGSLFKSIFNRDGVIKGCEITTAADSITVGEGYFIACGRLFHVDGATTQTISNPPSSGYVQLVYTIDLTETASDDEVFPQGALSYNYSATLGGFVALTQDDINLTGDTYAIEITVCQIAGGNITAVTRTMDTMYGLTQLDILNVLTSTSTTKPLSAAQGKALQDAKANKAGDTFTGDVAFQGDISQLSTKKSSMGNEIKLKGSGTRMLSLRWDDNGDGSLVYLNVTPDGGAESSLFKIDSTTGIITFLKRVDLGYSVSLLGDGTRRYSQRWASNGAGTYVYFGITPDGGSEVQAFQVNGDGTVQFTQGIMFANSNKIKGNSAETQTRLLCGSGGVIVNNLAETGYTPIAASAFNVNSSERYKHDIVDISDEEALKLLQVAVKNFIYNWDETDKVQTGVIAEEIAALGLENVLTRDDENMPDSVDYSKFTPALIKLAQLQEQKINSLTALLISKGVILEGELT